MKKLPSVRKITSAPSFTSRTTFGSPQNSNTPENEENEELSMFNSAIEHARMQLSMLRRAIEHVYLTWCRWVKLSWVGHEAFGDGEKLMKFVVGEAVG